MSHNGHCERCDELLSLVKFYRRAVDGIVKADRELGKRAVGFPHPSIEDIDRAIAEDKAVNDLKLATFNRALQEFIKD